MKKIPDSFLMWLQSYLRDRFACVKVNNILSKPFSVKRGVPQGSVLAPPLFCAFFSDLCSFSAKAATVKYADDLNVILALPSENLR